MFPFNQFDMTSINLFAVAGWLVAGLLLGKMAYKDYRRLVSLRREANNLAQELGQWGFAIIPKLLTDFVVTDPESLVRDIRDAADKMKNPKNVRAMFDKLTGNMVDEEFKDPTTRQAFFDGLCAKARTAGLKPTVAFPA
ncbi:MAG TPA: hypothetical protein VG826_29155 [Pirellulales bacterium]|nr:hypothetical protein [Pirellulales bacterium]